MKEIKAKELITVGFDDFLIGSYLIPPLLFIVFTVGNCISKSQPIVKFTIIVFLLCLASFILLRAFFIAVQMLNVTSDVYNQNGMTRKQFKKVVFEIPWNEINDFHCGECIFGFINHFELCIVRKKLDFNENKEKNKNEAETTKKSKYQRIYSFISLKQFIELQKICPLEIKMDFKVKKKLEKYKAKHNIDTQL